MSDEAPISKSRVRKIGSIIRKFSRGEATEEERLAALSDLRKYRQSFEPAMHDVENTLKSRSEDLAIEVEVSSRLKRVPTIEDKLSRLSNIDLSRMQDIGGCRVVTDALDELHEMRRAIEDSWGSEVRSTSDYVSEPRQSGYRAVHIIVNVRNHPIEIQLRTQKMHAWAQFVERTSGALGVNYKQDGDSAVQDIARALSVLYRHMEEGSELPADFHQQLAAQLAHIEELLRSVPNNRSDES